MTESRAQGRHAGLSREQVLRAAVELIGSEGVAALSMRQLARTLGVEAMTLYHHVRNKESLQDAIVEYVIAESTNRPMPSTPWQDALAGYARELHHGLLAHPGVTPLFATRPALTTRNLHELEALLSILVAEGFSPADALNMVHATVASVIGQHLIQPADATTRDVPDTDDLPLVRQAFAHGFPTVETRFASTMAALIAGFEKLDSHRGKPN